MEEVRKALMTLLRMKMSVVGAKPKASFVPMLQFLAKIFLSAPGKWL